MKKQLIVIFASVITLTAAYFGAQKTVGERNIFYQSGDFFNYKKKQVLIAPNDREIEFIEIVDGNKLVKLNEFKTLGSPNHILFKKINGVDYIFSLEGDSIVQYDLSDLDSVKMVKKRGPFWSHYDYYHDIDHYHGNYFLTAGKNGITIWSAPTFNYEENVYKKEAYGVAGYNKSIYAVGEEGAILINAERDVTIDKYLETGNHQHKPFIDDIGRGYFPGDDAIKFRTFSKYKNLAHPSGAGNAAAGFENSEYVYFANGWDVYKLDKALNVIEKEPAGIKPGDWAMGLKAINLAEGKRIVVFNAKSILLMDENLKLLDRYSYAPFHHNTALRKRSIKISPASGKAGHPLMIAAKGFWPGEAVSLYIGAEIFELKADNAGNIFKMTEIPSALPGSIIDILITGSQSGYEHNFKVSVK